MTRRRASSSRPVVTASTFVVIAIIGLLSGWFTSHVGLVSKSSFERKDVAAETDSSRASERESNLPSWSGKLDVATATAQTSTTLLDEWLDQTLMRGTVTDSSSAPIIAAEVLVVRANSARLRRLGSLDFAHYSLVEEVRTNSSGEFIAEVNSFCPYDLVVTDGESFRTALGCYAGDDVGIELPPASHLSGTVRGADGSPVSGARVFGWERSPLRSIPAPMDPAYVVETLSDADGKYSLALPQVPVAVVARFNDRQTREHSVDLTSLESYEQDFAITAGTRVFGEVADVYGVGIPNATVACFENLELTSSTNHSGYFEFTVDRELTSVLVVSAPYFEARHVALDEVPSSSLKHEVRIRLEPSRVVTGTLQGPQGEIIPSATITLIDSMSDESPPLSTTSFSDGRFEFLSLPANTVDFVILIEKDGFAQATVSSEQCLETSIGLLDAGVVHLVRGSSIDGRAVLATGEAAPEAFIRIERKAELSSTQKVLTFRRYARSDRLGRFVLSGLAEGEYLVSARKLGFPPIAPESIVVPEARVVSDLLVTFVEGEPIAGVVLTPFAEPVPHAKVRLVMREVESPIVRTNAYGEFAFHEIPTSGSYVISASPPASEMRFASVHVPGILAGDTNLRLVLPKATEIRGTTVSSDGSPAPKSFVYVYDRTNAAKRLLAIETTDSNGRFVSSVPEAASLELRAYPSLDAPDKARGFRVDMSRGVSVRHVDLPFDDEIRLILY